MARQLFIGLMTEGTTDQRFLKSVVERTFEELQSECNTDFDIFDIEEIHLSKGTTFVEKVLEAASTGHDRFSMTILCVQADADNKNLRDTYHNKIAPAKKALEDQPESKYCKILVAIVPIQEIEAWMLADKELLKREIGTTKSDSELGINREPETIANPKEEIEKAIIKAREDVTKKRRHDVSIANLYRPIGQSVDLAKLDKLSSYQDFKNNVREAYKKLNLLH